MSGFETLAQVYREIVIAETEESVSTGNIVCAYAVISTGGITLLAAMIIPDNVRLRIRRKSVWADLRCIWRARSCCGWPFHIFVVIVGVLILSGAVNTSIIGANGVMNRVAEDGVLHPWFQKPHRRFGTTYRIINLITILQIITVVASRGHTYLLGEAYAFGIVWSFFLKALSVLVLRFQRHDQEYKTPLNIQISRTEKFRSVWLVTTFVLFFVAMANLFSKRIATHVRLSFTLGAVYDLHDLGTHGARKEARERPGAIQSRHASGDLH